MGGAAFPNYNTPRLSHDDYNLLRDKCIEVLAQFYEQAVCPPEGPSKQDHGDVDLLVCKPKHGNDPHRIMMALGAVERTKASGPTVSYAVPLPRKDRKTSDYAQIDIHRCNEGFLEWEYFMNSYGDMVQILGILNRSIGLTMNDKGLHARVAEVESTNRKASMLHLTSDVPETLRFLGLDREKLLQGFASDEEVYEWCVSGRFYCPLRKSHESANDRARLKKRPMFTNFVIEWLPANPEIWENRKIFSRQEVLDEAVKQFGVQARYSQIMSEWETRVKVDKMLEAIKKVIPLENEGLGQVLKGLKRWARLDENGEAQLLTEPDAKEDISHSPDWLSEVPEDKKANLLLWVQTNYQELRRREKDRSAIKKDQRQAGRRSDDRGAS
jgi:hypothetical protein